MNNNALNGEGVFTANEAAKFLKVSTRTLSRYRNNGYIKYYQIGRLIRFKKQDLLDYLEKNAKEAFNF